MLTTPALTTHQDLMSGLINRHEELIRLVGERSVQYLDIPVHGNIGDLLIYLGTLEFLRKNAINIGATAAFFNHSGRRTDSVILLHGGGNFGDLYPAHQLFREKIISTHPENRIVVLPQSIHFESADNLRSAKHVISRHPDLHICVRDSESMKVAEQLGARALLMPDMAHQLYPITPLSSSINGSTLRVRRTDKESLNETWPKSSHETDWPALVGEQRLKRIRHAVRLLNVAKRAGLKRAVASHFAIWWERTARDWVNDATALFSRYETIATDRLHAHILACLMDKRSVVQDNSYGKNSSYLECWTGGSPLVTTSFAASEIPS